MDYRHIVPLFICTLLSVQYVLSSEEDLKTVQVLIWNQDAQIDEQDELLAEQDKLIAERQDQIDKQSKKLEHMKELSSDQNSDITILELKVKQVITTNAGTYQKISDKCRNEASTPSPLTTTITPLMTTTMRRIVTEEIVTSKAERHKAERKTTEATESGATSPMVYMYSVLLGFTIALAIWSRL